MWNAFYVSIVIRDADQRTFTSANTTSGFCKTGSNWDPATRGTVPSILKNMPFLMSSPHKNQLAFVQESVSSWEGHSKFIAKRGGSGWKNCSGWHVSCVYIELYSIRGSFVFCNARVRRKEERERRLTYGESAAENWHLILLAADKDNRRKQFRLSRSDGYKLIVVIDAISCFHERACAIFRTVSTKSFSDIW